MERQRTTRAKHLRVVKARIGETPILDLADGIRIYRELITQRRQLESAVEELRQRILRVMDRVDVNEFTTDGVTAIRQVRHFEPEIDVTRATRILRAAGRLEDAQEKVLDPEKARAIIDALYVQGKIRKDDLPYGEPREVEALIVRGDQET